MAMAQRLEVYHEARMGPKLVGRRKDPEISKKTKKGVALIAQGSEAEEIVQVIQNQPKK